MSIPREEVRELALKHLAAGDATGWFEKLYAQSGGDASSIPWADLKPNPNLLGWLNRDGGTITGRALVVGCGLGDDAEELSRRGLQVTAFDIAASAIDWCRRRFPESKVSYQQADLLSPPAEFRRAFDFVFESYTLQALPPELLPRTRANVADFVAPRGRLLIVCRAREVTDPLNGPPWPLTREDLSVFTREHGLTERSFEDYLDEQDDPPARRFRCVYEKLD